MTERLTRDEFRIEQARSLPSESAKQIAFFAHVRHPKFIEKHPEAQWLHSSCNGFYGSKGQKAKMIREGLNHGVWDISLDLPFSGYAGLRIEMKHGKNGLTESQLKWRAHYIATNRYCAVCYSHVEAVDVFLKYVDGQISQ